MGAKTSSAQSLLVMFETLAASDAVSWTEECVQFDSFSLMCQQVAACQESVVMRFLPSPDC